MRLTARVPRGTDSDGANLTTAGANGVLTARAGVLTCARRPPGHAGPCAEHSRPDCSRAGSECWARWKWPPAGRGPDARCRSLAGSVTLVSRIAARCGARRQAARWGKAGRRLRASSCGPAPGSARLGDDDRCGSRGSATRLRPRSELTRKNGSTHPARTGCRLEAGFRNHQPAGPNSRTPLHGLEEAQQFRRL